MEVGRKDKVQSEQSVKVEPYVCQERCGYKYNDIDNEQVSCNRWNVVHIKILYINVGLKHKSTKKSRHSL